MKKLLEFITISVLVAESLVAGDQHIVVQDGQGVCQEINIDENTSFGDVIKVVDQELIIANHKDENPDEDTMDCRAFQMNILVSNNRYFLKAQNTPKNTKRDYKAGASQQDKDDIYFIVKTLANADPITLARKSSELNSAGDRIDAVHPLNFLATVFTNEELKVCIRNLKGNSLVWKKFRDPLVDTLKEEHAQNNVVVFADDFASRLSVNSSVFIEPMQSAQWEKFIDALIKGVPRLGQTDRDM